MTIDLILISYNRFACTKLTLASALAALRSICSLLKRGQIRSCSDICGFQPNTISLKTGELLGLEEFQDTIKLG
jgi:hypothetical protein